LILWELSQNYLCGFELIMRKIRRFLCWEIVYGGEGWKYLGIVSSWNLFLSQKQALLLRKSHCLRQCPHCFFAVHRFQTSKTSRRRVKTLEALPPNSSVFLQSKKTESRRDFKNCFTIFEQQSPLKRVLTPKLYFASLFVWKNS
jgi:hypothetical protein